MRFLHIISNCNHAVSLSYFLSTLKNKDEHLILIDPMQGHFNDYFTDTKDQFPHTRWLSDNIDLSEGDIMIFHGLFSQNAKNLLPKVINSPIKTVWTIWGGDAALLRTKQNLDLFNKLDFVICAPGETLPFPQFNVPEINANPYLPPPRTHQKKDKENLVVLGNSGDPTNNHKYLLRLTKKFENAKFHVPFAYNGPGSYLEELSDLCKDLGILEKVYFQKEILSLDAYYELFSRAKVFLAAHNRQQAVGTMQIAYKCDCKVYLRKTITLPDNKTVINPGYLSLQMLGYPDIKDITSLEHSVGQVSLDFKKNNVVHQLGFGTPEYSERIFNILKRR